MKTSSKLFICCVLVDLICSLSSANAQTTNFTPATAAAYLKLEPPVIVEQAGQYSDGGSIFLTLVDSQTNKLHLFEDHSLINRLAGRREPWMNETNTSGRIYIGIDKPIRGGRLTSIEEGTLVKQAAWCLAVDWVDTKYTPQQQRELAIPHQREGESNSDFRKRAQPIVAAYSINKLLKRNR